MGPCVRRDDSWRMRAPFHPSPNLQSSTRSVLAMAMTVDLPTLERTDMVESPAPSGRLRRYARPSLGLLLPLGLALASAIVVCPRPPSPPPPPPPSKLLPT